MTLLNTVINDWITTRQKALKAFKDPYLSLVGQREKYAETMVSANAKLRELATTATTKRSDLNDRMEQAKEDLLPSLDLASSAHIWESMRPLRNILALGDMLPYVNSLDQLAALKFYARPIIAAEMIQKRGAEDPSRIDQALNSLEDIIYQRATQLGADTTALNAVNAEAMEWETTHKVATELAYKSDDGTPLELRTRADLRRLDSDLEQVLYKALTNRR